MADRTRDKDSQEPQQMDGANIQEITILYFKLWEEHSEETHSLRGLDSETPLQFINWVAEALSSDPGCQRAAVRSGMTAETNEVEEVLVPLSEGIRVRLVDTPGLEHTYMADAAVFKEVAIWLQDSFIKGTRVCAIFYLHDITREWITSSMRLDFEVLNKICGKQAMKSGIVTVITTRWNAVPAEEGEAKLSELASSLWSLGGVEYPSIKRATDKLSVKQFINGLLPELLKRDCSGPLYIQDELVNLRLALDVTEAGRCFGAAGPENSRATKPSASPSTKKAWTRLVSKGSKSVPQDPVLEQGYPSDIVIPIMGQTKAGKSTLVNNLLGFKRVRVGDDMTSCTKHLEGVVVEQVPGQYTVLREALDSRRIVFLDTPGFDDTELGDDEILIRIARWLEVSYRKGMLVGGVLYLHDIAKDSWTGTSKRNLGLFKKICGMDAMNRVALLTTKWGNIPRSQLDKGFGRVEELKKHWAELVEEGALIYHLQPPLQDSDELTQNAIINPWDVISNLVAGMHAREAQPQNYDDILLLQHELVRERRFLVESEAGKEVYADLENLLTQAKAKQKAARRGEISDLGGKTLEERQTEIDALRRKIDQLRPALSQRLMRWMHMLSGNTQRPSQRAC